MASNNPSAAIPTIDAIEPPGPDNTQPWMPAANDPLKLGPRNLERASFTTPHLMIDHGTPPLDFMTPTIRHYTEQMLAARVEKNLAAQTLRNLPAAAKLKEVADVAAVDAVTAGQPIPEQTWEHQPEVIREAEIRLAAAERKYTGAVYRYVAAINHDFQQWVSDTDAAYHREVAAAEQAAEAFGAACERLEAAAKLRTWLASLGEASIHKPIVRTLEWHGIPPAAAANAAMQYITERKLRS
jgi:hypothetical protein